MRSFTDVQVHLMESLNQDFKLHGFPCPSLFKTQLLKVNICLLRQMTNYNDAVLTL